ncbi:MAG TPA: class I SAM-dependent methyltransferase [Verrucomicrobiota bacterium]|nr:class I SAM-dependent methyltransferase [Verrucomicrobiota bacterium]
MDPIGQLWIMFYIRYFLRNVALALGLLAKGEWRRVGLALYARIYVAVHWVLFPLCRPFIRRECGPVRDAVLKVETKHPVAFDSPDHAVPHGTKYNNSTNRKFVLLMHERFRRRSGRGGLAMMDLGCSGGQLVADFAALGWVAVGLEGSDYSLKQRRANWARLANRNLFTCDIAKPFKVLRDGERLECDLITAWEVLEHIHRDGLEPLFANIRSHLTEGGLFIASTSSSPSVVDGVELHQTRMSNAEWRAWVEAHCADLEPVDLGLKTYQYVRFDFGEQSFLVYRKRSAPGGRAE